MRRRKKVTYKRTLIFRNKYAQYRYRHNLTVQEFARLIGKSINYVQQAEAKESFPQASKRIEVMKALNATFDELFYEVLL
jgi:transcriptional regulator with XRE-family HTH domain